MLIGISGMISSGKSTLTKNLVKHYQDNCLYLNEYEENDEVFNTFLKWLYSGKKNISLGFQCFVVENHLNRVDRILEEFHDLKMKKNSDFIFLDRFSLEHYIFAMINFENAQSRFFNAYQKAFEVAVTKKQLPNFVLYLDLDFSTFKDRLFARGRAVEIKNWDLNEEYFKVLHQAYQDHFINLCQKYKIDYAIIDTNNLNAREVTKEAIRILEEYKLSSK
ncbi:deoxynucleoside kinase [Mycoplasmopsis pullorum]|uniref:Deoxyguanosine kinase n=1 Tax=Mycoplasmopsis pullorum TaxID=48003 RepID=A0A1L4FSD6_9BACT|nr:deoxynucleoside kinase [Mycoplasmopsis pullorum]APJ38531.1 deoxyguanosine kinase [Mycoplasmopsis pullorum]TNK83961.1 deoxyguanosine kinase [Mycoplasmopsis pullorum]TNK92537.1 deoxyguanosine kinase [Mycoplasmopsis pullorum]